MDSDWQPSLEVDSAHSESSRFTWENVNLHCVVSTFEADLNVLASAFLAYTYETAGISSLLSVTHL